MSRKQSSYRELIDVLENLPLIAREKRRRMNYSLQQAADACMISKPAYSDFESSKRAATGHVLMSVLKWVARS